MIDVMSQTSKDARKVIAQGKRENATESELLASVTVSKLLAKIATLTAQLEGLKAAGKNNLMPPNAF